MTFGSKQCTVYCNNVWVYYLFFYNRLVIVAILSFTSADIVESLVSNVLLSGRLVNAQAFIILLLYE
jgi:hypothetical protein